MKPFIQWAFFLLELMKAHTHTQHVYIFLTLENGSIENGAPHLPPPYTSIYFKIF